MLHGWKLTSGRKIKAPGEDGGSTTCAVMIDDKAWKDLQNEYCTELKSQTKPFDSLESLANVCKLVLMDIFCLRGCDMTCSRNNHQPRIRFDHLQGARRERRIKMVIGAMMTSCLCRFHGVLAPRPGEGWKPPPPMMAASPSTRPTPPPSTPPLTTPPMAVAP